MLGRETYPRGDRDRNSLIRGQLNSSLSEVREQKPWGHLGEGHPQAEDTAKALSWGHAWRVPRAAGSSLGLEQSGQGRGSGARCEGASQESGYTRPSCRSKDLDCILNELRAFD